MATECYHKECFFHAKTEPIGDCMDKYNPQYTKLPCGRLIEKDVYNYIIYLQDLIENKLPNDILAHAEGWTNLDGGVDKFAIFIVDRLRDYYKEII